MPAKYEDPGYREIVEAICLREGFMPRVLQAVEHKSTALDLVANGLGITFIRSVPRSIDAAGRHTLCRVPRLHPARRQRGGVARRCTARIDRTCSPKPPNGKPRSCPRSFPRCPTRPCCVTPATLQTLRRKRLERSGGGPRLRLERSLDRRPRWPVIPAIVEMAIPAITSETWRSCVARGDEAIDIGCRGAAFVSTSARVSADNADSFGSAGSAPSRIAVTSLSATPGFQRDRRVERHGPGHPNATALRAAAPASAVRRSCRREMRPNAPMKALISTGCRP